MSREISGMLQPRYIAMFAMALVLIVFAFSFSQWVLFFSLLLLPFDSRINFSIFLTKRIYWNSMNVFLSWNLDWRMFVFDLIVPSGRGQLYNLRSLFLLICNVWWVWVVIRESIVWKKVLFWSFSLLNSWLLKFSQLNHVIMWTELKKLKTINVGKNTAALI